MGRLNELAKPGNLVLAEIYPRAMYGIAVTSEPVERRSRRRIDKGSPECSSGRS